MSALIFCDLLIFGFDVTRHTIRVAMFGGHNDDQDEEALEDGAMFQLNTIGPIFFNKALAFTSLKRVPINGLLTLVHSSGPLTSKATQAYTYVSYAAVKLALSFAALRYAQE